MEDFLLILIRSSYITVKNSSICAEVCGSISSLLNCVEARLCETGACSV